MNTKINFKFLPVIILIVSITAMYSCSKKDDKHVPPTVELKTTAGYTFADTTVGQGDTILAGVHAVKTEDDLLSFDVSVAYDGATTTNSISTENVFSSGAAGFDRDVTIITRNQAGTEKYFFTVTDRDGNIGQVSFTLTVQ